MATDPYASLGEVVTGAANPAPANDPYSALGESVSSPAQTGGPTATQDPVTGRWTLDTGSDQPAEQSKPDASAIDQLKYGLGVGTRDVLGGVGQLANFVQSPISAIWNGLGGKSADYEELADKLADHIGLPKNADDDHVGKAFRRGAIAGILTAGAATPLAGAGGATGALASALSEAPVVNAVSSGASGGASEAAKDAGAGPIGQLAAGLAGGGLAAAGMIATPALARTSANAARSIARPFTSAGAADQAAEVLNRSRTLTPGQIAENYANTPAPVDGVRPTLAEVAQDPGLAGLQRGHTNTDPNTAAAIHERHASNMLARNSVVQDSLGDGQAQAVQDYGAGQVRQAEAATAEQQGQRQGAVDRRIAGSQAEAVANRASAEGRVRQAIEALGPTSDRDATGSAARQSFNDAYRAAKARTSAAYNDPRLLDDQPVRLRPLDYDDVHLPDGPSSGTSTDEFKRGAIAGARGPLPAQPKSLLQFVRSQGGIAIDDANAGDIRHVGMDSRNQPGLLNKHGTDLDTLRELAVEQGYLPEGTDLPTFMDELDREHRGLTRHVRQEDIGAQLDYDHASDNRDFWRRAFDDRGLDPFKMTDSQWQDFHSQMRPEADAGRTFDDMDRQGAPGKVMGPFQKTLTGLRDRFYGDGGNEAPAYIKSFFNEVLDADNVGIRKLEGWEKRAYDLAGQAPDRANASFMQSVARAIGGKAAAEAGPGRRVALEAARLARREQGQAFETGDAAKTFAMDRFRNPVVGNNAVPSRLVRPGAAGGDTADGLIAAVGPEQAEAITRQEIRRQAEEKGIRTGDQARQFAVRYGEAAKRFPAVQQDLRSLETHAGAADVARQTEAQTTRETASAEDKAHVSQMSALQAALDNTPLARVADANTDPTAFVGGLLGKDDGGRQLKFLARQVQGNPEAVGGLRRALGDYITNKGAGPNVTAAGDRIPSINKMRQAISRVADRSDTAITPQQKIVLKKVSRELDAANFAVTAGKPAGSDTIINKSFKDLTGSAKFLGHIPMVGRPAKFILDHVVSALGNKDEVRDLITKSILDPDFAMTLLKRPTPQHWEQIRGGLIAQKAASSTLHPSLQPVAQFLDAPSLAAQGQPQQDGRQGDGYAN